MKSVLLSIRPQWCELIASGEKTIEVRKTKPKIDVPFKCYIYCTKDEPLYQSGEKFYMREAGDFGNGKVIGEFICDSIRREAEVADGLVDICLISQSCLSAHDIVKYAAGKAVYSWHISDLQIYKEPKSILQFRHCGVNYHYNPVIKRAPQSWCYAEEGE